MDRDISHTGGTPALGAQSTTADAATAPPPELLAPAGPPAAAPVVTQRTLPSPSGYDAVEVKAHSSTDRGEVHLSALVTGLRGPRFNALAASVTEVVPRISAILKAAVSSVDDGPFGEPSTVGTPPDSAPLIPTVILPRIPSATLCKAKGQSSVKPPVNGQPEKRVENIEEQIENGTRTTKTVTETESTEVPSQGVVVTIIKHTVTIRTVQVSPILAVPMPRPSETPHERSIDFHVYPHVIQNIVGHASPDALLNLRATCKEVQAMSDSLLCRHVVPSDGENLRTKHARIWFHPDDERVRHATFIDVMGRSLEAETAVLRSFQPLLANIRLIRTGESGAAGPDPPAIRAIAQAVPEAWISSRLSLSRSFNERYPQYGNRHKHKWDCPWLGAESIRNCVIQLSYNTKHTRVGESKVILNFTPIPPLMTRTHYILFCRHKQQFNMRGMKKASPAFALPPLKPYLLNMLVGSMVRPFQTDIVLVDADQWSHDWLGRRHKYGHINEPVVEDTPIGATIVERLEWWIEAVAKAFSAGDESVQSQAIENISFISMAEFKGRVPTAEMFQLITDPVGTIGVDDGTTCSA